MAIVTPFLIMAKKYVTSQAKFVEANQHGLTVYRHTCPNCRQAIHAQALVESFMIPERWQFWGEKGKRVKVCEGAIFDGTWFTHFAVQSNGKVSHRLAWEKMTDE